MEIDIQSTQDRCWLVRLRGDLRGESGPLIQQELHPLLGERDSAMVLDLSDVGMVDSRGLSQLISLATHARLSQARVVLVAPTPFVAGVFKMTKLDAWFEITEDVAQAWKGMGKE